MSCSQRGAWFERLLELRGGYPSPDDRTGVLSIADAMRYADAVMTAVERDIEPWLAELDRAFADEDSAGPVLDPRADSPSRLSRQRRFASDLWPWPGPSTVWPTEGKGGESR